MRARLPCGDSLQRFGAHVLYSVRFPALDDAKFVPRFQKPVVVDAALSGGWRAEGPGGLENSFDVLGLDGYPV